MDHEPPALPSSGSHADLRARDQITLSFFWFALNLQSAALLPVVIPTQILLYVTPGAAGNAQQAVFLGWLSALGAVVALVVQPIVGALSDRTPGRFGRRRPYIIAGTLALVVGIAELGIARDVSFFVLGFLVMNIGSNASTAAYQSLLPDRVPEGQRGTASGYMGLMTILGNVGSLALAAGLLGAVGTGSGFANEIRAGAGLFYALTSAVVFFGLVVTVVGVREAPLAAAPRREPGERAAARLPRIYRRTMALWLDPWQNHNFTWVFLTRAFVMLGLSLFLTFILYYFARVAQVPNFVQATAAIAALALVGAIFSALIVGMVSDRVRRVPVVCVATGLMACAALAFVIAPEKVPLWPLGIVFGLGYGAYTSVDWALAVDALPSVTAAGKDLGLWNIASTLPAILAPLLGSLIIASADLFGLTALGYRVVFGVAAFFLLLGAAFVVKVREQRGAPPLGDAADAAADAEVDAGALSDAYEAQSADERRHEPTRQPTRRPLRGWRLAARTGAGRAMGFLRFWPVWEGIMLFFYPVHPIPRAPHNLLLMRVGRYHGRPITLPDGTEVRSGDHVLELHVNNRLLARAPGILTLVRQSRGDLAALAAWTRELGYPVEVRAIYGFSLLSRAAPRLGFLVRDRRITLHVRLERFFLLGLMALYHGRGVERLRQGTTFTHYPQEIWMSIAELRRRYGQAGMAAE